jgi:hypothetical protein
MLGAQSLQFSAIGTADKDRRKIRQGRDRTALERGERPRRDMALRLDSISFVCSCWLAANHDFSWLVHMSGHDSVDTMWRAYHAGIPEAEAKKFWNIRPPTPAVNIAPIAKAS